MNPTRILASLALAAAPLLAQTPFEIRGAMMIGGNDLSKMTASNNLAGYSLDLAGRLEIKPGLAHRLYLGALALNGVQGSGLEGSQTPKHIRYGWDVVYQATDKLSVYGGFLAQRWKIDEAKATLPTFTDLNNRNNLGKGTKLGARIGLEYAYTKHVSGILGFTQTEFNKVYQPGWFDLGVAYRF